MAHFDSSDVNIPGQYPAPAFAGFGLPVQDETSGAGGSSPAGGHVEDQGATLEPGQYPAREDFTGVPLGGSGAPGSNGIGYSPQGDGAGGPDNVQYSKDTTWKSEHDAQGMTPGYVQMHTGAAVVGTPGNMDWTQANPQSYAGADSLFLPGLAGNMPLPGSGRYQTDEASAGSDGTTASGGANSSGRVMYGGFLNGARPSTSSHPGFSGPRT